MEIETAKGMKDDTPEEKIVLNEVTDMIRKTFESYGYSPIDTPAIEKYEILSAKYAGGAEILKETFKLLDQGKRKLGLRYDLTVPLARYLAVRPDTKMPFKRYHMAKVWRDGPVGLGRLREFWQCDVDAVGIKSMAVDAEMLAIAASIIEQLGKDYVANVNNRKLLNGIIKQAGIKSDAERTILAIDKIEKIGEDGVRKELLEFLEKKEADSILDMIRVTGNNDRILLEMSDRIDDDEGREGISELKELISYCKISGVNVKINVSLARGLAYYTGTIYEIFLKDSDIKSAIASGGRYDRMIGSFVGKGDYPALGISIGVSRLCAAISKGEKKTVVKAFVIPIGVFREALEITQVLRSNGINADIDMMGRGPSKNLEYANALEIPFVLFIGKSELENGTVKLRDMRTGKEEMLSVEDVCSRLKQ